MDSRMAFPYLLCPSPSRPHLCSTGALMVTARGLDLLPAAPRHLPGSARPTFSWGLSGRLALAPVLHCGQLHWRGIPLLGAERSLRWRGADHAGRARPVSFDLDSGAGKRHRSSLASQDAERRQAMPGERAADIRVHSLPDQVLINFDQKKYQP
jgi:hypothetical protein